MLQIENKYSCPPSARVVEEIRISESSGAYRVIYLAHCFRSSATYSGPTASLRLTVAARLKPLQEGPLTVRERLVGNCWEGRHEGRNLRATRVFGTRLRIPPEQAANLRARAELMQKIAGTLENSKDWNAGVRSGYPLRRNPATKLTICSAAGSRASPSTLWSISRRRWVAELDVDLEAA